MSTIDAPVDERTAAQLEDAPFPEAGPIPTAVVELEEGDGSPDAFGPSDSAAPLDVEDAVIEAPDGADVIPVTYADAAESFGSTDAGNELASPAVEEWHRANSTSAEALSVAPDEPAKEPVKRRGRRTNAEIAAEKAAAKN